MNLLGFAVVLVSLVGAWAQINVRRPLCDSHEADKVALVALDYLNIHHSHVYKYALNRIEDIKVFSQLGGDDAYVLELDLLETDCHVLDPTPVANCTVRSKMLTALEGDCDVVLSHVGGALTVTAFKCKTEESREDMCFGCPILLPLNNTNALDLVNASLSTLNRRTENVTFTLLEVGRLSSQLVSGGPIYLAEFLIAESNCTADVRVPLAENVRTHGFCAATGSFASHKVDCKMFPPQEHDASVNSTGDVVPASVPVTHARTASLSPKLGLRHHKLTAIHNPQQSGFLSESGESAEVVPDGSAADAAAPGGGSSASIELPSVVIKREAPSALQNPVPLLPVCPGRLRFF
ncbi:alpha-2-HS-glycoprotein-like [Brachionichthys hirsutus]|uniref:alpha-2-HS-glycoprotein-like n=1 Tax=Brachionichthys hirsutus TaxID=412623 RepID=UPI00360430F2